jgi:Zn-dependent protease with chaperone function
MQAILDAFDGEVLPVRTTLGYRFGVLLVTVVMLLLPLLYLGLIVAVAFLIYYHATANLGAIKSLRSPWAMVFAYAGPLIAGAVLLFFMIKPLFAGHSRTRGLKALEFGQEPLLFALVSRLARSLRTPEPKEIVLDCRVNASAGFGSLLGALTRQNLVLTIGLPLMAGLSVQQLAGVIAHELGHFSQGTGMRLSYFVRSINAWFARVVYERDDWDERLVQWSEESDRLALIFLLARLCVWLTRWLLWMLMLIGHVVSCFLLRHMEYDADRQMTRVVGTETFQATVRQVAIMASAEDACFELAAYSWHKKHRLPDDLCALLKSLADNLPPQIRQQIEKSLRQTETGVFDTHPSDGERLLNARREKAPGVFHLDWPSTALFFDFSKLSRAITLDFYRLVFGKRVRREDLVPSSTLLTECSYT